MNIVQSASQPLSPELIARFRAIVGDKYAVTDAAELAPYLTEERDLFHGRSPLVLRPGGLPRGEIERVLGRTLRQPPEDAGSDTGQPLAPGMLASHYAPRTPVRLQAGSVEPGEALLAFGPDAVAGVDAAIAVMNLSARGDLDEAATNLFGYLRALDLSGARAIAVMPVPHHGLGEAINDRLRRAAMGRESSSS